MTYMTLYLWTLQYARWRPLQRSRSIQAKNVQIVDHVHVQVFEYDRIMKKPKRYKKIAQVLLQVFQVSFMWVKNILLANSLLYNHSQCGRTSSHTA